MSEEREDEKAVARLLSTFVRETTKKRLPLQAITQEELASREHRVNELKKRYPNLRPDLAAMLDEAVEWLREGWEEQERRKK